MRRRIAVITALCLLMAFSFVMRKSFAKVVSEELGINLDSDYSESQPKAENQPDLNESDQNSEYDDQQSHNSSESVESNEEISETDDSEKETEKETEQLETQENIAIPEEEEKLRADQEKQIFEELNQYSQEKHGEMLDINGKHNIPILIFHEIRKDYTGNNGVIISDKTFEEYMLYLKVLGYQAISFDDYEKFKAGEKMIAKNSVIVTFDDGYYSNYELAYSIMKKLGIKGTVAVIGKRLDLEYSTYRNSEDGERLKFLNWEKAREMEESGVFRVEGHTYNLHEPGDGVTAPKGTMPLKDEAEETTEARIAQDEITFQQKMMNSMHRKPEVFVYPFGLRTDLVDNMYKKMGYKYTLGTEHGISDLQTERFSLKRINTPSSKSAINVLSEMLKLEGKPVNLPYSDIADQTQRVELLKSMFN